jgi:hypothetical protein
MEKRANGTFGTFTVHHHSEEYYGNKHVCKWALHTQDKCGCECYTEGIGNFMSDLLDGLTVETVHTLTVAHFAGNKVNGHTPHHVLGGGCDVCDKNGGGRCLKVAPEGHDPQSGLDLAKLFSKQSDGRWSCTCDTFFQCTQGCEPPYSNHTCTKIAALVTVQFRLNSETTATFTAAKREYFRQALASVFGITEPWISLAAEEVNVPPPVNVWPPVENRRRLIPEGYTYLTVSASVRAENMTVSDTVMSKTHSIDFLATLKSKLAVVSSTNYGSKLEIMLGKISSKVSQPRTTQYPTRSPTPAPTSTPTERPVPIIGLRGKKTVIVAVDPGAEYVDAGAWCTDIHEGDISQEIVEHGATISLGKASKSPHYVNYECRTVDGSVGATARRTVFVVASTPAPVPTPGSSAATVVNPNVDSFANS